MTETPTSRPPESGQLIGGRYRVDTPIGSGGMATVWRGRDTVLNRDVAVKVLHPHLAQNESFLHRFRQEARSAAKLSHPGIVSVYDTVNNDETEAIVMELVEGITLAEYMSQARPMGVRQAVTAVTAVAEALDLAHRNGVIHRDVKPDNILLCTNGRVKIADFGIAKASVSDSPGAEPTQTGLLLGTAAYLAPEQVAGEEVDGRADIYALAVVLYQLLCRRKPFQGDSDTAIALARLHTTATPLDQMTASVPVPVSAVVEKAMSRDPDDRYATAGEFRAALLDAESNSAKVMPPHRSGAGATTRHGVVVPTALPTAPPVDRSRSPKPAGPPARARRSRRASRSRWVWLFSLGALVAAALLLTAALLRDSPTSPDTGDTTELQSLPIDISTATPFDPLGSGTPGENDSAAPRAIDRDPDTAWRTETYEARDFGTKSGVGLVLETAQPADLDRLLVSTLPEGWRGEVFVLQDAPVEAPRDGRIDGGQKVADVEIVGEPMEVSLDGVNGSRVLVWITDLGPGSGAFRVDISEVELYGRAG